MALYDNPLWVLSHIRNSFVVSDDTGNCELVFAGDKFSKSLQKIAEDESISPFLKFDQSEDEEFQPKSLEIRAGHHPLGYRPRCNTEIKLEKMKRERSNAPSLRAVSWRPPSDEVSEEDLDKLFPRKIIVSRDSRSNTFQGEFRKSLLSEQLSKCSQDISNPFQTFSEFSGENVEEAKSIRVFLSICRRKSDGSLPYIKVKVKPDAKVFSVIGYVCYVYTQDRLDPPLKSNVDLYSLFLYEDGCIERDLPSLENHEMISRYGFTDLALVESPETTLATCHHIRVTLPDGAFTVIELSSKNVSLQEVMDRALSKRQKLGHVDRFRFVYDIEKQDAPGVALDPTALLSGVDTSEFYIVRRNSRRFSEHAHVDSEESTFMNSVDAMAYKEFPNLKVVTKIKKRVEVICAVSENKFEIVAMHSPGTSLQMWTAMFQSKVIKMEDIVSCDYARKDEIFILTLVHRTETFSKMKLECDDEQRAKEICARVKCLINHQSLEAQKHYKNYLQQKSQRRRTLHF